MQAGIRLNVSEDAIAKYTELRMKKAYRYIIYRIDQQLQEIAVERTGAHEEEYETFKSKLPENDCRFIVYDLDYTTDDNCHKSKIFFISWTPDSAKIKARMMYASSKERFKEELEGVHYEAQATDPTELDKDVLLDPSAHTANEGLKENGERRWYSGELETSKQLASFHRF
ncbi:hypothetical protein R1flu_029067 [Riccia fluitans]|uniref:ADF-H domain-containing protein n=1 Tax=Riccia fluitans TaxID=41844 RepID=A0ABD1XNG5_9MARC